MGVGKELYNFFFSYLEFTCHATQKTGNLSGHISGRVSDGEKIERKIRTSFVHVKTTKGM